MRNELLGALLLVSALPLSAGCGDDAEASGGGSTTSTTSTASGSTTGAGGQSPEDLVPPEPLGGDPAVACPAAYAASAPVAGDNQGFEVAGQSRRFYLIEPDASFTGPRPLLVGFNGTNETGKSFSDRAELEQFAARGFVVVAPWSAGNGTLWPVWDSLRAEGDPDTDNPDLALFDALVACVGAHRPIDKHRIYATGHSAGGIMTNYVMQRRSELLAGGIVASGVFSLTSPEPAAPLDDVFVIVTWGGDNDEYSGGSMGVSVPSINFVEQASIASTFYDAEPNVSQANCRGNDLGHAWLPLNDWFVDALLDHPKGLAQKGATTLPALEAGAPAACTTEPFVFTSSISVTCPPTSTVAGCAEVCQFMGDCAVENATVGPILAPQLTDLGFSGPDNTTCDGCITHCEGVATAPADAEVLGCMQDAQGASVCGPGIDGALPVIDALNACCEGRSDSPWCMDTCTILLTNSAAAGILTTCDALVN
jgi:predicted esterase